MDQELRTFLQEQFHEIRQHMEEQIGGLRVEVGGLREETRERFEKVDERFEKVDERFETVGGQIGSLREESREGIRHTHILLEDVQGNVRLLAEGMVGLDQRMIRTEIELNRKLDDLWGLVAPVVRHMNERVTHLEEVENQRSRDIMDVIRERYGSRRDS